MPMASQTWNSSFNSPPISRAIVEEKKNINGDVRPFTNVESHFADAKFFEEGSEPKEMIISTISSTSKGDYQGCACGNRARWCKTTTIGQRGR